MLAAVVPLAGGMAFIWWQGLQDSRVRALALLQTRVDQVEHDLLALRDQSEWVMSRMANRPAFRALSPSACDDEMAIMGEINPAFLGITLWDREGALVCSSIPLKPDQPRPQPHRKSFDAGIAANGLYLSDVFPGQITGLNLVTFTYPVRNAAGATAGLLSIPMRTEHFAKLLESAARLPGRVAGMTDRNLVLVARVPGGGQMVGKSIEGVLAEAEPASSAPGALLSGGMDGVKRLFVRKVVPAIGWRIFVGVEEDILFAGFNRQLKQGEAVFAIVIALSLGLAYMIARSINGPLRHLVGVVDAVSKGSRSTRADLPGRGEIPVLAGQVNRMLDALERSEASLRESEAGYRTMAESSPDAILIHQDLRIVFVNRALVQLMRASAEADLVGKSSVFMLGPEQAEQARRRSLLLYAGEAQPIAEQTYVRLDGTPVDVEIAAAPLTFNGGPAAQVTVRDITARKQAEAHVRASEARLRAIFETEPECVTVLDRDGYVRDKNAAGLAVLEADSLEQLQRAPLIERVLPAHRAAFEDLHRRVMNGESGVLEFELEGLKGRRRWLETHAAPLRDAAGEVTDMLGITLDITERKRMHDNLRASEERLRLATEGARIGTWDWDIASNRVRWDPVLLRMFGLDAAQFETDIDVWFRLVHAEDRERLRGAIRSALKDRARYTDEFRIAGPGGRTRWIAATGTALGDPKERATRMVGTALDITERKQIENALRESEDRYRALAEYSPDAILIHQDYRIVFVNPAMVRMVRAGSAADLVGKPSVALLAPEFAESSRERSRALYAGEPQPRVERVCLRLDGTQMDVEIAAAPLVFGGKPAAQVTVRDITARKVAERLLRASMARTRELAARLLLAEEAERKRIAHDLHDQLGQDLTAIKIRLDSIARTAESPALRAQLQEAAAASGETLQRVRQMSVDLRPPQLDNLGLLAALRAHVERQGAIGKVALHFDSRGFTARLSPDIEIVCFRVVQEAITNVMRHAGAANAWIELQPSGDGLRIVVRDDGIGFDADRALERGAAGGGLGLPGMQERVALVGGTLDIRSHQGQGCTVTAIFPLSDSARAR